MDVRSDDPQGLRVEAQPAPIQPLAAHILRGGVLAASVLLLVGTAITFARHPDYRSSAEALRVLLAGLPHLRGQGFVLAGLILLIATPIVRVAVTATLLWNQGERRLAGFGAGVLVLLLVSLALGHAPA